MKKIPIRDPGWKINSDPGSGINIPDTQHWLTHAHNSGIGSVTRQACRKLYHRLTFCELLKGKLREMEIGGSIYFFVELFLVKKHIISTSESRLWTSLHLIDRAAVRNTVVLVAEKVCLWLPIFSKSYQLSLSISLPKLSLLQKRTGTDFVHYSTMWPLFLLHSFYLQSSDVWWSLVRHYYGTLQSYNSKISHTPNAGLLCFDKWNRI